MFTDRFATAYFEELVRKYDVQTVVETGTYLGESTVEFARRVGKVETIDVNGGYLKQAKERVERARVSGVVGFHYGNSAKEIPKVIGHLERYLYFLDAHWGDYWPLLHELRAIARMRSAGRLMKVPVILIHDFCVPGSPKLGYDTWKDPDTGQQRVLNWEYVERDVLNVCRKYVVSMNHQDQAEGHMRGILRCEPPEGQ